MGDLLISKFGLFIAKFSSLPYTRLYSNKLDSKILILGNSRAYHHLFEDDFIKVTGKTTINLSQTGTPLIHLEPILYDYIDLYGFPDSIIIETDCLTTNYKKISAFKYLINYSKRYKFLFKEFFYKEFLISSIFKLYSLNSTEFLNLMHKVVINYRQPYLDGEITQNEIRNFKKNKTSRFTSISYNYEALKRIVKKLEGKSKITFITTPFNPNVLNLFGNEYDEMIEPLRNEFFSDDNFFDLSNSIKDNLYFYDNYHLNRKGVVELKKKLIYKEFLKICKMSFPNVIFVGAEKSGSTTIHNILCEHEDIFAIQKETEFFSFFNKRKSKNYHINDIKKYQKLFDGSEKYKIKLDVSTTYLCSPDAIKNIKKYSKNCKIIICLRNPIDRAYSRYWMSAKNNHDLVNYSSKKFLKFFFEHNTDIYWSNVRIRGMYYKNVKSFIKEFGKSNVLILFYDDLKKNSNLFFKNIYDFFLKIKNNILPNKKNLC